MTARPYRLLMLAGLLVAALTVLAAVSSGTGTTHAQACPPHCPTPIVTPAWHIHMCDMPYQEQLFDNHCMIRDGVTEFPEGTDKVYVIYCHRADDLVVVQIKDSGGGLQYVNHPDGITYGGNACETLVFSKRNGIPAAGSPYYTSAYWPEGPFHGVSRGISWLIGLFIAFDQENYYGTGAEAHLSARDPGASLDPTAFETITARVTSGSDPVGIAVTLREEMPGFSIFRSVKPVRFSTIESDEAAGVIKVANRDTVTVSYCPRNCSKPYVDTATWYQLVATVTPTGLPTWPGPPPTPTTTPPPDVQIEYISLRPAPDDVGYASQITNRGLPNHLGYPSVYAGMWTRGSNQHHGMVQFDLGALPAGARLVDARIEMVGRDKDFTDPGSWSVKVLDRAIDAGWRSATFDQVTEAGVLAQIGSAITDVELAEGRRNAFGFAAEQLLLLEHRLTTTRKVSFRVDGPPGPDENLFAWHSGVDKYRRDPVPPDPALGPVLELAYVVGAAPPSATPTTTQPGVGTTTAVPGTGTAPHPSPSVPVTGTAAATPSATAGPSPTLTPGSSPTPPDGPTVQATPSRPTPGDPPTGTPDGSATLTPGGPPTLTPVGSGTATVPGTPTETATATGPADQRQVCVVAFDDVDADGARDPWERYLPGVTIKLTHVASGAFVTWTTDGRNDPDYCWSGLTDGRYSLASIDVPHGYAASGPSTYSFEVPFPGQPARYGFALRHPDVPTPTADGSAEPPGTPTRDATSPPPATATLTASPSPTITPTPTPQPTVDGPSGDICVAAYRDDDASGTRQVEESFIPDMPISIRDIERWPMREVRSLDDRLVCSRLPVGVYYVRVDHGRAWKLTTGAEIAVLLTDRQRQIVEFGLVARELDRPLLVPYCVR